MRLKSVSYSKYWGLFALNSTEIGTLLFESIWHNTVPIKLNTSVTHVTAGLQLLNQLLNNSIPASLWSRINLPDFSIKTLVFGLIDCPFLVPFQKWAAMLSQRECDCLALNPASASSLQSSLFFGKLPKPYVSPVSPAIMTLSTILNCQRD